MARITGFRTETYMNIQMDCGVITVGGDALGATRGGASFSVERDIREPELDGAPGPIKGLRRIISQRAILTVSALEITAGNASDALNGAAVYLIPAATHKDITIVGQTSDGGNVTITMSKCISESPSISMTENSEGSIDVTYVAHFTAGSDVVPYTVIRTAGA